MRAAFTPVYSQKEESEPTKKQVGGVPAYLKTALMVVGLFLGAVALVFLGVFIARTSATSDKNVAVPIGTSNDTLSEKEIAALLLKVKKHMILPRETPQIVAIANVDQLKIDQPFFRSAQNGDQLLVYENQVILYRPGTDQIVDIAQIRATPSSTPGVELSKTPTPSPRPTVIITWTPTPSPADTKPSP